MSIMSLVKANANSFLLSKPRLNFPVGFCCSRSVKFTANSSFRTLKVKSFINPTSISTSKSSTAIPFNFQEQGNNYAVNLIAWFKAPVLVLALLMTSKMICGCNSALAYPVVKESIRDQFKPETKTKIYRVAKEIAETVMLLVMSISVYHLLTFRDTAVVKFQVASHPSAGMASELNAIARTTDTAEGSIEIFRRLMKSLRSNLYSWNAGYSSMKMLSTKDADKYFKLLSTERGKFDEEYFSFNNVEVEIIPSQDVDLSDQQYMVVTVLVLVNRMALCDLFFHMPENIMYSEDLRKAFRWLLDASYECKIQAVKMLWTPHLTNDIKYNRQLAAEYPLLKFLRNMD